MATHDELLVDESQPGVTYVVSISYKVKKVFKDADNKKDHDTLLFSKSFKTEYKELIDINNFEDHHVLENILRHFESKRGSLE